MGSTAGPNMRSCNWTGLLPRFNFGIDENFAAAVHEHLKTIGAIPDDAPVEADGQAMDTPDSADFLGGANAPGATPWGG